MTSLQRDSKVLIIGAGVFGISTAYHLLKRDFTDVTVLERSETIPARDAASNDFNRIVRTSYSDKFYTELGKRAIELWKDRTLFGEAYQESGVVIIGPPSLDGSSSKSYVENAYANDCAIGARAVLLDAADPERTDAQTSPGNSDGSGELAPVPRISDRFFSPEVNVNPALVAPGTSNYVNLDGGWANAKLGVEKLCEAVVRLGGKVLGGKTVRRLVKDSTGRTVGVECEGGERYDADIVVLAVGSWTRSAFPELDLGGKCLATGQSVAMIQLTEEERQRYSKTPVILDFNEGFYTFPPTKEGIFKIAIHSGGNTVTSHTGISTPRTYTSNGEDGLRIPRVVLARFRAFLRKTYPDLAEKPFVGTRLCWYNDTPDADYLIGRYPNDDGLVLATGDSGHAYKMLPVLGTLVADLIMGTMDPTMVAKFAVDRTVSHQDDSRRAAEAEHTVPSEELVLSDLCTPEDLVA